MTDDSLVYIKQVKLGQDQECITMIQFHENITKIGSDYESVPQELSRFERYHGYGPQDRKIASYSGPKQKFGLIGTRKCRGTMPKFKSWHNKKHCSSFLWINNEELVREKILFQPWKAWEDLNLCNEVDKNGYNVLKLNYFEFTKTHSRDNFLLYKWKDQDYNVRDNPIYIDKENETREFH